MRASSRAQPVVRARLGACAARWCAVTVLVCTVGGARSTVHADGPSTVPASSTSTPAPREPQRRDGPWVIRLSMENDNLLFGNYARMVGRDLDGSDLGRTHASSVGLGYDFGDRAALRLDLSSQLFTAGIDGAEPSRNAMVPIVFHELDRLRLGVALRGARAPWRLRFGLAVEASNHEEVTFGATGQQRAWHEFMANTVRSGAWQYDHQPSGLGVQLGAAADASTGGAGTWAIAPWLSFAASGSAGARLATIVAGTALTSRGRIGFSIGDPLGVRLVIALQQRAYLWAHSAGVMLRSSIDARLDFRVLALQVGLHRHDGDQNVAYFFYVFPNTTMTVALTGRI